MKRQNIMMAIIGILVFVSSLLAWFNSKYWLLFIAFIGLNLFQFAFSNWCLMETMLKKLNIGE